MKLGIIVASIALAAVTGCAAETEPQEQEQKEASKDTDVKVEVKETEAQPQMICRQWGYIDAKRVCLY